MSPSAGNAGSTAGRGKGSEFVVVANPLWPFDTSLISTFVPSAFVIVPLMSTANAFVCAQLLVAPANNTVATAI